MKYLDLLDEKLKKSGVEINFTPIEYNFPLLADKQAWVKANVSSESFMFWVDFPIFAIKTAEFLIIYDWGEIDEKDLTPRKIKFHALYPYEITHQNKTYSCMANYNIFGGFRKISGKFMENLLIRHLKDDYDKYGLDYIVWVSKIESCYTLEHLRVNLKIRPEKFTFKGFFLEHLIQTNTRKLTLSFLIETLFPFYKHWLGKKCTVFLKNLLIDKASYLDALENAIIKEWLKKQNVKYETQNTKDIEQRVKHIQQILEAVG